MDRLFDAFKKYVRIEQAVQRDGRVTRFGSAMWISIKDGVRPSISLKLVINITRGPLGVKQWRPLPKNGFNGGGSWGFNEVVHIHNLLDL